MAFSLQLLGYCGVVIQNVAAGVVQVQNLPLSETISKCLSYRQILFALYSVYVTFSKPLFLLIEYELMRFRVLESIESRF